MHKFDDQAAQILVKVLSHTLERLSLDPVPLDKPQPLEYFEQSEYPEISEQGNQAEKVFSYYKDVLEKTVISVDSPKFLSFIPSAPTKAAILFDLVVSAASLGGISWDESSGVVWAEKQVIRWLADLASFPKEAGGCFMSGGTISNLSALTVARSVHRENKKQSKPLALICSDQTHSSIQNTAHILDCQVISIPTDQSLRLNASLIERYLSDHPELLENTEIFAVVANAGTTNLGVVDDFSSIAKISKKNNWWLHIDGAYGGAALLSKKVAHLYKGIEHADSYIVDPHKWFFAPFDCAALIYRNAERARKVHSQKASYLDVLQENQDHYNPSDYGIHLSRRARGLPFWFSLTIYGVSAYREAIESSINFAQMTAKKITSKKHLKLIIKPSLSIVAFERLGWKKEDYQNWTERLLNEQKGYVVPSSINGKSMIRFAFIHPDITERMIDEILESLE